MNGAQSGSGTEQDLAPMTAAKAVHATDRLQIRISGLLEQSERAEKRKFRCQVETGRRLQ